MIKTPEQYAEQWGQICIEAAQHEAAPFDASDYKKWLTELFQEAVASTYDDASQIASDIMLKWNAEHKRISAEPNPDKIDKLVASCSRVAAQEVVVAINDRRDAVK